MKKTFGVAAVSLVLGCSSNVEVGDESGADADGPTGQVSSAFVNAEFVVRSFGNRCVDVGGDAYQAVGAPVYVYACNGSTAQKLRVVEIADGTFDVSLRTNRGFCLGVRGGGVAAGRAIELQTCNGASPAQRFALDGDTIFVGTQASGAVARNLVLEVFRGRGANRTPLVVGPRELDPAEDFRFVATSFAALVPTSGFKLVSNLGQLDAALGQARPGTVIEVAPNTSIRIDDENYRDLQRGVTLRSGRRGLNDGGEIYRADPRAGAAFRINGDNVRVTGLRLRGPSPDKSEDQPTVTGVLSEQPTYRVLVDHAELSAWTAAAVSVRGNRAGLEGCVTPPPQNTRVIANYVHDNSKLNHGYGVVSLYGGNAYIDGNTFARNRHAIAADNNGQTSYSAHFNLVTESNGYHSCTPWHHCWKEHDFDVHGTGDEFEGGRAGHRFDIRWNTFFPDGVNIRIRGTPCLGGTPIVENVFYNNNASDAIEVNGSGVTVASNSYPPAITTTTPGDFDGDGVQDDFIGTGRAWFYRPGGASRGKEWRLLNRFNERNSQLTFGDFDGDGRTDIRVVDWQGKTVTSWGGSSPWDDGSNGSVIAVPVF